MLFHTIPKHIDHYLDCFHYEELNQMLLADIIELCHKRNLPTEGTKSQLISDILFWKEQTTIIPAPSTPQLNESAAQKSSREYINSRESSLLFHDDSSLDIPYKELEIKNKIGSGGFKDCYQGKHL
ncbi:unnamed protein product [Rhizopus stolonifer]